MLKDLPPLPPRTLGHIYAAYTPHAGCCLPAYLPNLPPPRLPARRLFSGRSRLVSRRTPPPHATTGRFTVQYATRCRTILPTGTCRLLWVATTVPRAVAATCHRTTRYLRAFCAPLLPLFLPGGDHRPLRLLGTALPYLSLYVVVQDTYLTAGFYHFYLFAFTTRRLPADAGHHAHNITASSRNCCTAPHAFFTTLPLREYLLPRYHAHRRVGTATTHLATPAVLTPCNTPLPPPPPAPPRRLPHLLPYRTNPTCCPAPDFPRHTRGSSLLPCAPCHLLPGPAHT